MLPAPPKLSLIILGFRDFERHTKACLESLNDSAANSPLEFLVVDNGSGDESADKTEAWCFAHPGFQFLRSDENRGFAGGMNYGAAQARGKWLLLVNNDTIFPEGAVEALLRAVSSCEEDVGMLCPITNAAGNGQRLWLREKSTPDLLGIGKSLIENPTGHLMPTYRSDFFCVAIRREAWEKLGGLDTEFGLGYYEDFDFSLRLRAAGYRQMITEDVFVIHVGSATFSESPEQKVLLRRNKKLLKSKHPDVRFEHCRDGNLAVLQAYMRLMENDQWSEALQIRLYLRLLALRADEPRSLMKKLFWRLRTSKLQRLRKECRDHSVRPL